MWFAYDRYFRLRLRSVTRMCIASGSGALQVKIARVCMRYGAAASQVRFQIIRSARISNVGKYQSCMVSKLRIISDGRRTEGGGRGGGPDPRVRARPLQISVGSGGLVGTLARTEPLRCR